MPIAEIDEHVRVVFGDGRFAHEMFRVNEVEGGLL